MREAKTCSKPIQMGIFEIVDLRVTSDSQHLLVAYSSGVVNLHSLGDKSNSFVCQVQPEYKDAFFQKLQVIEMQDNSFFVVCLRSPTQFAMRKVLASKKHTETVRTIQTSGNVLSFVVHISNKYLLALTDQSRIEIYE